MTTTIFHCSDLHFGAEDREALAWFAAETKAERPDAIVVTGDLTMRAREREFAAAGEWMAALRAPVTVEVGNHDLPYFNPIERLLDPYRKFHKVKEFVERPLLLPDCEILPLRTTARAQWRLNWSKGKVNRDFLDAAIGKLAEPDRKRIQIIAAHHPLVRASTLKKNDTRGGVAALDRLVAAGADAILTGHVHDGFDKLYGNGDRSIRLIGAGTLSERVRAHPPSFNRLRIDDGRIEVEPVFFD